MHKTHFNVVRNSHRIRIGNHMDDSEFGKIAWQQVNYMRHSRVLNELLLHSHSYDTGCYASQVAFWRLFVRGFTVYNFIVISTFLNSLKRLSFSSSLSV